MIQPPSPDRDPIAAPADDLADDATPDDIDRRLRGILSQSGAAAAWEWHVAARRIIGDAGFATLYGIDADAAASGVTPGAFFAVIHPLDRDRIRLAIGGMLRGAELLSKEYRIILPDGQTRWLHARGRSHYDAQEQSTRFSGVLVDITEQKRLEEQLRIAETAGGVGTFEYVDGYGTVSVSAQFCNLLGLHASADLPVRTVNALVWPGDPPIIDMASRPAPGAVCRREFRILRPDTGEQRWLTCRGEYLHDTQAAGTRFSGVIYDVSDAKAIEAQLRTLNDTLEARVAERTRERDRIWRVSQDLLGVADLRGYWLSVNPAWESLLGWTAAEIVGQTSEWLMHPDDQAAFRARIAAIAVAPRTFAFENRLRRREGGHRWLSWTAVPEGDRLYCVARDVTAEKDAAAALALAEEQLRQSQKMEAVGQLTGGLAHDFNNLLTGIAGSLELLQTRMAQGRITELERYITAAQSAARRAAALTHRLLAFSRRQTLAPRATDVNRLIAGLEELVRRTVGPAVTVEVVAAVGLWNTLVDPNQLENALLNLCINARDAMPEGGRLTIEPANHVLDGRMARGRDLPPGEYVSVCVSDSGIGMTQEVMARAFDPFFTTKPIGQGTGLGLSMIYGFARQSGGQVRIHSTPGQGTTVCVYLPRHLGESERATPVPALGEAPRAERGETVLVVDDEPTVRMLVSEVLEDLGYTAIEAADGAAGLQVLQSDARVDLLVTDVGLPGGMNGRQVADAGRALRPGLKVLFITGYAENAVLSHGHLEAGMHVLIKPFPMETLANRIKSLITSDQT